MKLSHASAYALHALCRLAAGGEDDLLPAARLAPGTPLIFLRKALGALVSAGVLRSVMGPGGGYRLAKPADKITLLQVVEAVDGPVRGEDPFADGPLDILTERLHRICEDVAAQTRKALGRVRLSDLAGGG
jgi:Rrf2 family protein